MCCIPFAACVDTYNMSWSYLDEKKAASIQSPNALFTKGTFLCSSLSYFRQLVRVKNAEWTTVTVLKLSVLFIMIPHFQISLICVAVSRLSSSRWECQREIQEGDARKEELMFPNKKSLVPQHQSETSTAQLYQTNTQTGHKTPYLRHFKKSCSMIV